MAHTVCTYDGDFHCDQIFACYLIKKLLHVKPTIIRTRDSAIIGKCDYVIGVGSVYDHNKLRYDHHHLDLTLKSLDSSKPFKIKLSCAGLVYHHYGRSIIAKILNLTEPCFKNEVESLFDVIYENFVQEIDAMANRIAFCEGEPNFKIGTDLTSRINRLRLTNSLSDTENDLIQRFSQAIDIVGNEFEDTLKYYGNIWLPAKTFVKEALLNCKKVHSSGAIIDLSQSGGMPWIEHLINIERELNIEGQIKFAIFYDVSGIWRLSCVPVNYSLSELRIPFPPHWYGLNYHNLCDITGVPGCIYIHPLIGDFETKEACVAIATKMLQSNAEKHLNLNKSNSLSDGSFYSLTENLSIEEQLNEAYEKEQTDEDISRKFKRSSSMSAIEEELPEDWDPMKEDARSLTNTYAFDPSDIGAAIQGYKSGDLDKVCQRFLNGYCKFGENCVYKHLTHSQIDSLDTEEVLIDTFQSELVKVGMSLKVTVTECLSPYSLYVTPIEDIFLEQKFESRVGAHYDFIDPTLENYLNLTKELTDFYRRVENKENFLIYPAIGSLVAARSDSIFFRGRVIDMSYDEDELHIMNIDTGVESMVDRRDVLSLKPKFATLPAAAIHCAVDVPQGISITDQVMNNFSELVLRKRFKVQFVDKDMEGRYKINLFNFDGEPFVIDWNLL